MAETENQEIDQILVIEGFRTTNFLEKLLVTENMKNSIPRLELDEQVAIFQLRDKARSSLLRNYLSSTGRLNHQSEFSGFLLPFFHEFWGCDFARMAGTAEGQSCVLSNGSKMPLFGLGTWKIAKSVVADVVYDSIVAGVRHLDCACDYGNEVEVGNGIKRAIDAGIVKRQDLWVTSKLWNTYHAKEHVKPACQKSLSDMGLEYFDLYLIHFPISQKFVPFETRYPPEWIHDPSGENPKIELNPVPYSETWAGMESLVDEGLVRNIGVANLVVQSLMDLLSYCRIKPVVNQVELHPYLTQQELLEYSQISSIHLTAFSPLGSSSYVELGMDYGRNIGALQEEIVQELARKYSRTPAQIILRWGVQRGVSVIPKSSRVERVVENMNIFNFELSAEDMERVSGLNCNLRFNNPGVFCKFMGGSIPIFG